MRNTTESNPLRDPEAVLLPGLVQSPCGRSLVSWAVTTSDGESCDDALLPAITALIQRHLLVVRNVSTPTNESLGETNGVGLHGQTACCCSCSSMGIALRTRWPGAAPGVTPGATHFGETAAHQTY
ncbi:hypothetical protein TTRE_0000980501 [Trichuris trichiura]|uniref:Uncharacterized protein n=1 Tax=Trichuris trichiura TaxID=36087 RepID=A0A077ZLZ2_TRITR|nr:hypothetical protein TTRE_0000980501 [Trichuris trichiura]